MVVDSFTISTNSSYSKCEIEKLVFNSYESQGDLWRLGEPPRLGVPLGISLKTIPLPLRKSIQSIIKFSPHLFWNYLGETYTPEQYLMQLKIKFEYDNIPSEFDPIIIENSKNVQERISFQMKFNLLKYLHKIIKNKTHNRKEIFHALNTLKVPYYSNYSSFSRFLSKKFKPDDANTIFHISRGKVRPDRNKWNPNHVSLIKSYYSDGFDSQQITDKLKEDCEKLPLSVISKSTVKRIIKLYRLDVLCAEERLGTGHVKNEICGYIDRKKPEYKMQVVESDGSRLQLPYRVNDNSRWKVRYLTLYVIIDISTTRILGYSVDDFENQEMVLMAFYMMFSIHKRLPAYLKIDRSSAHKSKRFNRFLTEIAKKGVGYRFCYEPRDKGVVESFYHWFPEKICKLFSIYTGLSLVSKSWFNQPNPENVSKILNNVKNLPTREELIQAIPVLINRWDNRFSPSIKNTPLALFKGMNYKNAIFVEDSFAAYVTWRIKSKNRFSRNTISHFYKGEKLSYRLSNSDNIINTYGKEITIAWLETDTTRIYVFDNHGTFIELAYRKNKYLDDPISIEPEDYSGMIKEKNSNYKLIQDIRKKVKLLKNDISKPNKELIQLNVSSGLQGNKVALSEVEEDFIDNHYIKNNIDKNIIDDLDHNQDKSIQDKRFSKFKWINNE